MLKFKANGQVVMTESDNGDVVVSDKKLAESLKEAGVQIQESKGEEQE